MPEPPLPNVAALVLAAGKSTRMKSRTPKALHPLLGRPLLRFALDAAAGAGAHRTVLVVGHQAEAVQEAMGPDFEYVLQAEQRGTGHAVQMAEPLLADWDGPLLVLPGDAPLITAELLHALIATHTQSNAAATLLTATLTDAGSYGRIVRDGQNGPVRAIVEARDATPEQLLISEIGTSIYAFDPPKLFAALRQVTPQNVQNELYLTDVIALLAAQGERVEALISPDADVVKGVNTRVELVELSHVLQAKVQRKLMLEGVTIIDPATTYIEDTVNIGQDTVVHPFSILSGVTDIGQECQIGPGARLSDARLGNSVHVRDSYVTASEVGDGTRIGPFANIRPGSVVGKSVKIGDFVELKNATLHDGVSAGHLAYLGDAEIGANTNIGAGTITCNYDPFLTPTKNKTTVGARAFIGTHSTLVAPVAVGDGAYTAAGSVITDDVPGDSLGIGRARQVNKDGWVAKKRKKE
ncbi:MAG: bifunctional UDP-N-acetylglucosamine diphosphorylase/glucosamine-1-phosphate N-acetyltransferase GlmU [Armatimonadota bacterium]|nr:bifunctional UDP-N-acetylglucosamine diphosphorylase/glucosamine-1-phosphate N-acetyltransferase GlmU [Armatimonadota bacterium]